MGKSSSDMGLGLFVGKKMTDLYLGCFSSISLACGWRDRPMELGYALIVRLKRNKIRRRGVGKEEHQGSLPSERWAVVQRYYTTDFKMYGVRCSCRNRLYVRPFHVL
jgi:hypothetical protein